MTESARDAAYDDLEARVRANEMWRAGADVRFAQLSGESERRRLDVRNLYRLVGGNTAKLAAVATAAATVGAGVGSWIGG